MTHRVARSLDLLLFLAIMFGAFAFGVNVQHRTRAACEARHGGVIPSAYAIPR